MLQWKKRSLESGNGSKKIRDQLVVLADRDAEAFEPLSKAYGMPKETEEQKAEKERVMENALYEASVVPLQIMETVKTAMDELELLEEKGSRIAVSDAGVGILFAQAALEGASLNIFINTRMMKDRMKAEDLNRRADELIKEGTSQKTEFMKRIEKNKIAGGRTNEYNHEGCGSGESHERDADPRGRGIEGKGNPPLSYDHPGRSQTG